MHKDTRKVIQILGLLIFFLAIGVYAFFRSHDLIFGVKIIDVNIVNKEEMEDKMLEITGNARNAIKLTLNGREISIDQDGNFKETLALLSGYNIVNIRALDKFEYSDEKNYKLIYKEKTI
jgi:hypothetical protein